jgi:uncharacterized protein (DUF1330 family)
MPAYLVITARIHDRRAFIENYGKAASELVTRMGGRYLIRAPGAETLEGPDQTGVSVVVSEWPDRAAAYAFWTSEEYAELRKLRQGLAECQILLVEG